MKILILIASIIIVLLSYDNLSAQVGINDDGSEPDASAILHVQSIEKGLLPPRMTSTQRDALESPANGLMIYNIDTGCMEFFSYGIWMESCGEPLSVTSITGRIWMDRNLGASRQATSSDDAEAYGDLFQWGRASEGHEKRNSSIYDTQATSAAPNGGNPWDGKFITHSYGTLDWLDPQDPDLWQGVEGINNPCPKGYRLPTATELNEERLSWVTPDAAGAFASPLKLTAAGIRYSYGSISGEGTTGNYSSSTTNGIFIAMIYFHSNLSNLSTTSYRVSGNSVRCIKD